MNDSLVERYGAWAAFCAGVLAFLYATSFVVWKNNLWSAVFLMLGGLLTLMVMVALFLQVRKHDEADALAMLVFGLLGGVGSLIHGAYDLANVINPPGTLNTDLPQQFDPRGVLVFGLTGLALALLGYIMRHHKDFTPTLKTLTVVSAILLLVIYLARLVILTPTHPLLLYPVLLEGFIINPLWYIGIAFFLRKHES